jgi:hypothetical protein
MISIDRTQLLAGMPIQMPDNGFLVYPATLLDIASIGTKKFFSYLNLITIDKIDLERMTNGQEIVPFDFFYINCLNNPEFLQDFLSILKFFVKSEVKFLPDFYSFIIEDSVGLGNFLTTENMEDFQIILRVQNFISTDDKPTKENASAKLINKKLRDAKAIVDRIKSAGNQVELADLISALTVNTTINIKDVWSLTYYTLNDQFKRMRLLEQYNTSLQSIMAGADPKKIELKDWIQNIQNK